MESRLGCEHTNPARPMRAGLCLLVATLVVSVPILGGQVLGGHDIVVYLINAQQMTEIQREGEVFPAWAGGYNAGFGAPTLLFFPPLTSYLHASAIHLGIPVIIGVCAWSMVGLFLSGAAMLAWLRSLGCSSGALAGALVYMIAPYRIIDLYHRSALAEHWAFVWPPLILWASTAARVPVAIRAPMVALSVAGLLLSNIPLALLFGLGLAIWFVLSPKLRDRRWGTAGAVALGFSMAAFALVPQAMSASLLAVDQIYGSGAGRFRPSANTLFSAGFEASSFNTVVSILVVATMAIVLLGFGLASPVVRARRDARIAVVAAIVCCAATIGPAGILWDALPVFSKLQFPWRVASVLTFALAFVVAAVGGRRGWLLAALVAVVSAAFTPWSTTLPISAFSSPQPPPAPAGTVFPDPRTAWEAGSGGWYWRHHNLAEIWFLAANVRPFLLPELAGNHAPQLDAIRDRPAVLMEAPEAPVEVRFWGSVERAVTIQSPVPGTLLWRVVDFPEMSVTVDRRPVETHTDPGTGLVAHAVPAGEHEIEWRWRPFAALRWARRVSMVGFSLTMGILLGALGFLAMGRRNPVNPSG